MQTYAQSHVSDKGENHESHGDSPLLRLRSLSEIVFTAVEQKLIRLAVDPAATESEADVCGIKLIRSLRRRGVSAERLIASMTQSTWAARDLMAARGYVVQGGKFQGKTVGELPMWYLKWALKNRRDMSFNLRRAMQLIYNEGLRK
jgi:hypothetical protein